jgi:putative pyruvate formate lyase activating enzyme
MNNKVKIAWYGKHFGEEPPLTGDKTQGAGTIFFTGCNSRCVFCQNYQISQEGVGKEYTLQKLVEIMLDLQENGAINIDLVSPTIWWCIIKKALILAKKQSLTIPIVWNSNGYESLKIITEMKGLVDIYLPDFKYSDDTVAMKYSGLKNYFKTAQKAIEEMWKQVGELKIFNGLAKSGLIVRHLILPNHIENSFGVLKALSEIDLKIHISLMSQYYPMHKAKSFPEINRPINPHEFEKVYNYMIDLGFENGWIQDMESQKVLIPDFNKKNPFK